MISLVYLAANSAFAFVLGRDLRAATMFRLDGEAMFFPNRDEAALALARHRLALDGDEVVTTKEEVTK
jgi:hypothetical protein